MTQCVDSQVQTKHDDKDVETCRLVVQTWWSVADQASILNEVE